LTGPNSDPVRDFWLSSGHHLLDRDARGHLRVTDEFMKVYLARPELTPPPSACVVERTLHAGLLADPWQLVDTAAISLIADPDARENWHCMIDLRDRLAAQRTIEAAYAALVRGEARVPSLFLDQLVHLILRNALDGCDDAHMLRAAELFFRPQRVTLHDQSLLAADQEHLDAKAAAMPPPSPLAAMFGLPAGPDIEVLSDATATTYWERSDCFDLALDLTTGRRGLVALAAVIARFLKHMLDLDVSVEPLDGLRDATLSWYVGLDAGGTQIGDALWNGAAIDEATRARLVGLFRLTFRDANLLIERVAGEDVYLILAVASDGILRMKPHNLITGLPLRSLETAT
jgi:hypothetical protein